LLSILRAHQQQQCNNFKDSSVQHYGGLLFKEKRDKIDELFLKIPPPIPKTRGFNIQNNSQIMSNFYNPNNPCFSGDCLVLMNNKELKLVENIKKNDEIFAINGKSIRVLCVVKTNTKNKIQPLVHFKNGLKSKFY
jgi:hypothetical protein